MISITVHIISKSVVLNLIFSNMTRIDSINSIYIFSMDANLKYV